MSPKQKKKPQNKKKMDLILGKPPGSWARAAPAALRAASGVEYTLHAVPPSVIARPAGLFVLRGDGGFVCEGEAGAAALDPASAMPVVVYRADAAGLVVHVPCGAHDAPPQWTFLAPTMRYVGATFESAPRWASAL